ncbi:putative auxin response factor [Helianthus debilis subsp. tardiflorus]
MAENDRESWVKKTINSELWHACAGPLVTLPQVGSLVYYFSHKGTENRFCFRICCLFHFYFNYFEYINHFFVP